MTEAIINFNGMADHHCVTVVNGQQLEVKGRGSARRFLPDGVTAKLTDVMYVLTLNVKLVSVAALADRDIVVYFQPNHAVVSVKDSVVVVIPKVGNCLRGGLDVKLRMPLIVQR